MSPATVNSEVTHLPKTINILCFGDSLTAGFTHTDVPDHPYATSLQAVLAKRLVSYLVNVQVQGLGGDKVTGNYLTRMKALCGQTLLPATLFCAISILTANMRKTSHHAL